MISANCPLFWISHSTPTPTWSASKKTPSALRLIRHFRKASSSSSSTDKDRTSSHLSQISSNCAGTSWGQRHRHSGSVKTRPLPTDRTHIVNHLFALKEAANENNEALFLNFHVENHIQGYVLQALRSKKAAVQAKPDKFQGLPSRLSLVLGAQVFITNNICTQFGLCNGAQGTVVGFAGISDSNSQPSVVLVKMFNYTGPDLDRVQDASR